MTFSSEMGPLPAHSYPILHHRCEDSTSRSQIVTWRQIRVSTVTDRNTCTRRSNRMRSSSYARATWTTRSENTKQDEAGGWEGTRSQPPPPVAMDRPSTLERSKCLRRRMPDSNLQLIGVLLSIGVGGKVCSPHLAQHYSLGGFIRPSTGGAQWRHIRIYVGKRTTKYQGNRCSSGKEVQGWGGW